MQLQDCSNRKFVLFLSRRECKRYGTSDVDGTVRRMVTVVGKIVLNHIHIYVLDHCND